MKKIKILNGLFIVLLCTFTFTNVHPAMQTIPDEGYWRDLQPVIQNNDTDLNDRVIQLRADTDLKVQSISSGTNVTITGTATNPVINATSHGTDSDAIHDNVSGEISAITLKNTPISTDVLIIEDSADSNNKKRVTIGSISGASGVTSVNTRTGDVILTATDVSLENCDNTSDANKPVSTATQTALDGKEPLKGANDNYVTDAEKTILSNTSGTNTGDQDLSLLALKNNVLELDNTATFTPSTDYHPATKVYVDNATSANTVFRTTPSTVITAGANITWSGNTLNVSTGTSTDSDAIHDNVSGEISAITLKNTPISTDVLIIEDSADSNNKKRVTIGSISGNVSTSGSPLLNDFARFTDASTIEGRSYTETKIDLGLNNVDNTSDATKNSSVATLTNKIISGADNTISNINLATQVIGDLSVINLDSGTNASAATFWRGDGTWGSPSGSGDVVGPASAVDSNVASYDTTTGKLLKDSGVATSDIALLSGATFTGAVDMSGASSFNVGPLTFQNTDASPSSVGQMLYDNTVTGLSGGTIEYYDTVGLKYLIGITALPTTTGQVMSYNDTTNTFEWTTPTGGTETNSLETTITGIADTEIFIGNGVDSGTFSVVGGDASLSNTGYLAINTNAITEPKISFSNSPTDGYIPTYNSSGTNQTWVAFPVSIGVAASDETTDLTTGTTKTTFRTPYAFNLVDVRANVNTAPTGATLSIDINEGGTSVLSTVVTIDATEKTSVTAATPPVISDSSIADDAEITIDIDQIGSTTAGKGLKIWLIGTRTL